MAHIRLDVGEREGLDGKRAEGVSQVVKEMEIKAAVEALKLALGSGCPVDLNRVGRIVIYTDSQFLVEGAGSSAHTWSKQGWTRRGGAPLVNTQLWQELLRLASAAGSR